MGLALGILLIGICVAVAAAAAATGAGHLNARALRLSVEVLLLLLSGALLEEAMFRGYPFQRLVEAVGPVWAVARCRRCSGRRIWAIRMQAAF